VIDSGATGLMKASGALTALHERTERTVEEALTAIERIEPLDPNADLRELRLTRSIVRSNLEAILREVQQEPRAFQMDALFESLLGPKTDAGKYKEGGGYLGQLQRIAGLGSSKARLTGDFEQYTRFLLLRQSIESLAEVWQNWRREAQEGDLGVQFVRVTWLFQAVRETVAMFREELDDLGLGEATRWTLHVNFTPKTAEDPLPPMSLGAFLDVIDSEGERWRSLIEEGGAVAGGAIREFVGNVHDLVRRARPELMSPEKRFVSDKPEAPKQDVAQAKRGGYTMAAKPGAATIEEVDHLRAAFETAQHRLDTLLEEIEDDLRAPDSAVPYEDRSTL
jgi:hypothetical protein